MVSWLKSFLKIPEGPKLNRILLLSGFIFLLYVSTLLALFYAWYQVDTSVPFHWFDDSKGWLFVDKFGHFYTTFIECGILLGLWRWTGVSKRTCLLISVYVAMMAQSSYEIFDGMSAGYGASISDIYANLAGAFVFLVQHLAFNRLLLTSKFSFHTTAFAHLRPAFFGDSIFQQILKDYNGQTYWFTLDFNGLLKRNILPSWLFLTVGYGGDGMLGGDDNIWTDKSGQVHDYSSTLRSSRVVFSFDFNWEMVSHPWLKRTLLIFNYIKFPAPALEVHLVKGVRFYWLYF